MSSASRRAGAAPIEFEPFVYPLVQPGGAPGSKPNVAAAFGGAGRSGENAEEALKARIAAAERQARELGAREAETRKRAEYEQALAEERKRLTQALEGFAGARKSYFERAEAEVVHLALGIARKILHREAQVDPLFLAGLVRVALEKVAAGSAVRLHVAESDVFKWRQVVASLKGVQPLPEVVGDPAMPPGRCVIESEVGTTQISLETQFREVERGMLDLLALRPNGESRS